MLRNFARHLRRRQTPAERRLWQLLRSRGLANFKFRRQVPVGPYIADFLCFETRLVIEADGGQHAESASDAVRTAWLAANGFRVLRFWNSEILGNPTGVGDAILAALDQHPSP